jgi:hypothetical protein
MYSCKKLYSYHFMIMKIILHKVVNNVCYGNMERKRTLSTISVLCQTL